MNRLGFALMAAITLAACGLPGHARADAAVVTVTGAIAKTNRPAFDPFVDALFNALDVKFDRAFAFSRADLLKLPQRSLEAKYPNWPAAVRVSGPNLKDVLAAAGARGDTVIVRAVDGYAPELTMTEVQAGTFVLALAADGKPLSLGGRGPLWLVFPPQASGDRPDDDSGLAWAVFHIEVR